MDLYSILPIFGTLVCGIFITFVLVYGRYKRLRRSDIDYQNQTIENEHGVRQIRSTTKTPATLGYEFPKTMLEILEQGARLSKNGPCLGYRKTKSSPYTWLSYKDVISRAQHFGAGLVHLGIKPNGENFFGILAATRVEWVIAEYACYSYSAVIAPLYDSLGPDACQLALNSLNVGILLCGNQQNYRSLTSSPIKSKNLNTFIFMDDISQALRTEIEDTGSRVFNFWEVEELGKLYPCKLRPPQPDDIGIIMFTSGTTGTPKAAMLTHRGICSSAEDFLIGAMPLVLNTDATVLAFLPLAHIMERLSELLVFTHGGKVGFNSSGIIGLYDDMQILRPNVFTVVPRILSKLHGKLLNATNRSFFTRMLLKIGVWFKTQEMKLGIFRKNSIWDKLLFHPIQNLLGGNVQICGIGSAPIDEVTMNTMRAALGCYIFELYGQTESSGVLTMVLPGDMEGGHVGVPTKDVQIKLVDVPELSYYAKDGKGEICAKTLRTLKGYYKNPEKTAEAIDSDGWLHTGDVGQWLPSGRLKIIDRKKHIFKLSQGEYIAPEKIENVLLGSCQALEQIFVDGNSLHPFTVALVYPNRKFVSRLLQTSFENINQDVLKAKILEEVLKAGKENRLNSFEIPKKIVILPEQFTLENGFLTPTQKVKREAVREAFKTQLENMYKDEPTS